MKRKAWINTPARKAAARRNIKKAHAAVRKNGKKKKYEVSVSIPLSAVPARPKPPKKYAPRESKAQFNQSLVIDLLRWAVRLLEAKA